MTSRVIEKQVVTMDFDAALFKKGIEQSLRDIETFKSSMKFDKEARNLQNLGSSANTISFKGVGDSIGTVTARVSAMGVVTAEVIRRMTSSILDSAKKLVDNSVFKPMRTGLEEYETQMNSIQTILANTSMKGTTLMDVEGALDELNLYADRTIYNFTQMTESIGKFTAAGVELKTSVGAIKGIANLAAVSGSGPQQASNAMYQLSQAIATGSLKLQDWNSVVNAGMGGQVFQEALQRTARAHGVAVDSMIRQAGSFRASLEKGWITSEILLETLNMFTGDLNEAQLEAMGYTQEQIAEIMQMAEMANAAATEIKTLTQLKDTMAEAAQSGWAQTWRTIVGDFHSAKDLFRGLGERFGGIIEASSEARNNTLSFWARMGGRDELMAALFNTIDSGIHVMNLFKEAWAVIFPPATSFQLYQASVAIRELTERFKMGTTESVQFKRIVTGLASALDIIKMLFVAIAEPIVEYVKGLNTGGESFLSMAGRIGFTVTKLRDFIIETDFFRVAVANVIQKVKDGISWLKELRGSFLELGVIRTIAQYFKDLGPPDLSKLSIFFDSLKEKVPFIKEQFDRVGDAIKDFLDYLDSKIPAALEQLDKFKTFISDISLGVGNMRDSFMGAESVQKFLQYIDTFDGSRVRNFIADFKEQFGGIGSVIDKVKEAFGGLTGSLFDLLGFGGDGGEGGTSGDTGAAVTTAMSKIDEIFSAILDYLMNSANNIDFVGLLGVINAGIATAIGGSLAKTLKGFTRGSWIDTFMTHIVGSRSSLGTATKAFAGAFNQIESTMVSVQTNLKADALLKIAGAIGLLVASILVLTLVDANKLLGATAAMAAILGQLIASSALLGKMDTATLVKATTSIVALSASLLILSIALHSFSSIDQDQLGQGLLAMGASLAGLVLAVRGLSGTSIALMKQAAVMTILSLSLILLSVAIKRFGSLDSDVMEKGLIRIGIALAGFVGFSKIMNEKDMLLAAADVGLIASALIFLADAVLKFGQMSWDTLIRGLTGVGVAMGMMAIAARAMVGTLPGAAAMVVMSGAIFIMAEALTTLSILSWEELLKSLVGLAGIFLVLGLAGLVLVPVIPALLGIGAALLLIGIGTAALGIGIMLTATGLLLIAGSAAAMGVAVTIIGTAIMLLLPKIAEAIAEAVVSFLTTLADAAPELLEAGKTLLLTLIRSVTETIPAILEAIVEMLNAILDTLVENAPGFIEKGLFLLLEFLRGIEENIQEVVSTAINIVTNFIQGLTDSIPDLIDAAFEFILTFIEAMADAVEEYTPQLIEAINNLGAAIIDGLIKAIMDGVVPFVTALGDLAQQGIAAFQDIMDMHSPSRVFTNFGDNVVHSFIDRVRAGNKLVKDTFYKFGSNAQNGMRTAMSTINSLVDQSLDINPIIRPVLDMSDVNRGITTINDALTGNKHVKASAVSYASNGTTTAVPEASSGSSVTYIQNNYSPKALNRAEIYRQTNMQLGRLAKGVT